MQLGLIVLRRHLDNVVLKITPVGPGREGAKGFPAVLIASHYDSAVCSKGASDDASQVCAHACVFVWMRVYMFPRTHVGGVGVLSYDPLVWTAKMCTLAPVLASDGCVSVLVPIVHNVLQKKRFRFPLLIMFCKRRDFCQRKQKVACRREVHTHQSHT